MHIKGWEGRRSSDLTISVIGMCVREMDIEEGKGRGREVGERGERKREGKGRVGREREKKGEKEEEGRREREDREQYGWNKSL